MPFCGISKNGANIQLDQYGYSHMQACAAGQWMHCVKLLGQRLSARDFDRQVAEIQIRAAILNGFTALSIPRTVAAD
jgi:hypothetical protein